MLEKQFSKPQIGPKYPKTEKWPITMTQLGMDLTLFACTQILSSCKVLHKVVLVVVMSNVFMNWTWNYVPVDDRSFSLYEYHHWTRRLPFGPWLISFFKVRIYPRCHWLYSHIGWHRNPSSHDQHMLHNDFKSIRFCQQRA